MSMVQSLNFGIQLHGDGTSTSITVTLSTAPISFASPTGQALTPSFALGSLTPAGLTELSCSSGATVTGSIGLMGLTMTLNLSSPIANGTDAIVYGTLLF